MKKIEEFKKLKKGYTTGVHTSIAFKSALEVFLKTQQFTISKTNKMDNDDLDVTKGCKIIITLSMKKDDLILKNTKHKPYIMKKNDFLLKIYSGIGVGVVTKEGLKPPIGYPAINPIPLKNIENIFYSYINRFRIKYGMTSSKCQLKAICHPQLDWGSKTIFMTISVTDGEEIAKKTANKKVGILGGISILGTTGFVKPISATAYIDSIEQELNFANSNNYNSIIFTLGNKAYSEAIQFKEENQEKKIYIIEIGNFIYDGLKLAVDRKFQNIELWLGIGKAVKVSQGFKNTHNRFGGIDFNLIQDWINQDKMIKNIKVYDCLTIKRVNELLKEDKNRFQTIILKKAKLQLLKWFGKDIQQIDFNFGLKSNY